MKKRLKNLVKNHHFIDHMPFGSIEELAKELEKDRGTIRGVLQGKWVNMDILEAALRNIRADIDKKNSFLAAFEKEFTELKATSTSNNK